MIFFSLVRIESFQIPPAFIDEEEDTYLLRQLHNIHHLLTGSLDIREHIVPIIMLWAMLVMLTIMLELI